MSAHREGNRNRESSHAVLIAALCVVRKIESAQTVVRRRTTRHRRALAHQL
ncbi:MAG: hypothetical protein KKF41_06610 [Actinobacteria bacterium]|nr:hypothetical protein [Actinomycetota bacterium]MBU1942510.1 hypothetical protein [Actinomycetota bacterium]MBU2687238.1 hypothetical protein [Actinomycetota bacterium]